MPITPLPTPPSRTAPATFSTLADAFLGALPTFQTEANALETNVNAKEVLAAAAAVASAASEAVALAAANYKGPWASQSGAAAVPYSVSHIGKYWQLASDLADVTAKIPGTDAEWLVIGDVSNVVDATLSGTPVILVLKGSDGNDYYVKGYPTKA